MQPNIPSVTNADDAKLVALIQAATRRVVLIAPGVSSTLAKALCDVWQRLGTEAVNIVLDVDPEVCRLGYGTIEGLTLLAQAAARAQTLICHHPGVRIGLLVCDDTALIFSATPLLVEAGSTHPNRPNAILLNSLPESLARDLGLGQTGIHDRTVGLEPVRPEQIRAVQKDLDQAPPLKFDLARRVRVFTSRFQFVELELTGCFIFRKKVPIPSELVGLHGRRDIEKQFHAHFNMVNPSGLEIRTRKGVILNEEFLKRLRQDIERRFLIQLEGYGKVVLRANEPQLLRHVRRLRAAVKLFQRGIRQRLQKRMDENVQALVEALYPAVKANPPDAYRKFYGPNPPDSYLRQQLTSDISKAFGRVEDLLQEMKVSLVFKEVAYESLVDPHFIEVARKAMPGQDCFHEEFDAARAQLFPNQTRPS